MSTTAPQPNARHLRHGRFLTRKHCWMLVLAFEILVLGFTQSMVRPVRQRAITIEMSVTPNHVVT